MRYLRGMSERSGEDMGSGAMGEVPGDTSPGKGGEQRGMVVAGGTEPGDNAPACVKCKLSKDCPHKSELEGKNRVYPCPLCFHLVSGGYQHPKECLSCLTSRVLKEITEDEKERNGSGHSGT